MATIVTMYAVMERLQTWFAENGYSQVTTQKLADISQRLKPILADAKRGYPQNAELMQRAKQWMKILYDIENIVESYKAEVASSRSSRGIIKRIINYCKVNHNFGAKLSRLPDQISSLTDQMSDLLSKVERDGLRDPSSSLENEHDRGRRSTASNRVSDWSDNDVIRIEEEEKLVSDLTGGPQSLQVISICGMPGSGKTTLAKSLCNRPEVKNNFQYIAWADVTQEFRTRDIFADILQMVAGDLSNSELQNNMDLALAVHRCLKGRRWLVVLDDIWSIEAWESIHIALPVLDHCGARILVTTRDRDVAVSMSGEENVHNMRLFDEPQSMELFKRATHLKDTELNSEKGQIARKLVGQAGGLPLAIIVLANVFNSKSVDEWRSLAQQSDSDISGTHIFNAIKRTFELSYNSLPVYLMPCLLYTGIFPKGSKMEADKLGQLWIAEGLVSEKDRKNGETLMEVARRYFDELAARNLVHVSEDEMSNHPSFKCGILHDRIRDICITKAKEEEFFHIEMPGPADLTEDSVFRRAINLNKHGKTENIAAYDSGSELRTLLFFTSFHESGDQPSRPFKRTTTFHTYHLRKRDLMVSSLPIVDLRNLKWIRVLHFDGVDFKGGIPVGIGNLVLLRYLSFRDCYLEELPSSISNLLFLITLDLQARKSCRVIIPNTLFKLERLRHLYLPLKFQTDNRDKLLLDGMKELEILENFDTSTCVVGEIFKLTSFRNLVVSADGNLMDLEQIWQCIERNVNHLKKTSFSITNFDSYSDERLNFVKKLFCSDVLNILHLEGRIGGLPEIVGFRGSFITEIRLNGSQLEDDSMQTLQMFPHLRILALEVEAYIGKEMYCSFHGFYELRSLTLSKLYNLESWEMEEEAMPKLCTLSIENCRRMKMLPEGLKYIDTLRKLKINMMPKEFVDRLREVYGREGEHHSRINTKCTIEFGSDDPQPEFTNSATEQNNSVEGETTNL